MVVRVVRRWREAAQTSDIVFVAYVAFSGLLLVAFGWQLGTGLWVGLTLAHAALLLVGTWAGSQPLRGRSLKGLLRDIYPFIFIFYLYFEIRYLALLFSDGFHDATVQRWELALFGEQLAMTLSQRFPDLWLSEVMHFFYAFYWFLLPAAALLLYFRGRLKGLRDLVYAELVVFFGCYLVFIFWPVQGPHYEFPVIGGRLAEGPMYRWVHWVLEDGGSKGAAFPSSHVAVAVTILAVTWRRDRLVWAVTLPFVIGLTLSTVYGRFHYGIDALTGWVAATLFVPLAWRIAPYLKRIVRPSTGNGGGG
ncbi:MAG: phosphatase PAP2 family protein [Gemmatimonadetes bacterium]|nr:phosphatase PAP2 family protein [Gemmatimonadota bacterium]